jgi:predicted amidohydrolase
MIVAGLQLDIAWENPEENFRRAGALIDRAIERGASLLALPEMFAAGFSMRARAMAEHAESIRDFLSRRSAEHGIWLIGGYHEPGEHRPSNACSVFDPDGAEVLHYRKIHPFSLVGEHEHFEAGGQLEHVEINGIRVTPLICYDLRFPELFRAVADSTDLFVVIANWPERRSHAWRTLLAARAIDDQAWVLGVNRVGEGDGHPYRGDTSLLDPWGEVMATLAGESGIVVGEVDADVVRSARERFGFLADRRPDLYRKIEDEG